MAKSSFATPSPQGLLRPQQTVEISGDLEDRDCSSHYSMDGSQYLVHGFDVTTYVAVWLATGGTPTGCKKVVPAARLRSQLGTVEHWGR
jgi:hypothetical protein